MKNKKIISILSIIITFLFLASFIPADAAVVVAHSNTSSTAIEIPAAGRNIQYIMSRGMSHDNRYIVDSSKWFKFKASENTNYEFRVTTPNQNREITMNIYEEVNGGCSNQIKYTDISNVGEKCSVSICKALQSGKTYYINCISVVADPDKEPATSNVCHEFHVAKHSHSLSYLESGNGKGIIMYCLSEGCDYAPVYAKIASITVNGGAQTIYNGSARKPTVTIKDNNGSVVNSSYYTLSYSSGCTNPGTYSVTATFKQPYAQYLGNDGKTTKKTNPLAATFTILPKAEKMTLSTTTYTYNGSAKKPSVTITDSSSRKVATSYYTVTYPSGCTNVGTYTVKATLKSPYSGSKTATFKINPTATTLSSLTAESKGFTAKWSKKTTQVTGYQVQYSTSSTFASGNKSTTISSNSTVSKKITGLTAKKKYYVRVRTYKTVSSTNYYSAWSAAKSVTTK